MNFKESYLIPKSLYEALKDDKTLATSHTRSNLPADIQVKLMDYQNRFQTQVPLEPKTERRFNNADVQEILEGVQDVSRRSLARDLLHFIKAETGGAVTWDDNFKVVLQDETLFDTDIRDCIRMIVGEIPVAGAGIRKVLSYLKAFDIPSRMLMYINPRLIPKIEPQSLSEGEQDYYEMPQYEEGAASRSPSPDSPSDSSSDASVEPAVMTLRGGKKKVWLDYKKIKKAQKKNKHT